MAMTTEAVPASFHHRPSTDLTAMSMACWRRTSSSLPASLANSHLHRRHRGQGRLEYLLPFTIAAGQSPHEGLLHLEEATAPVRLVFRADNVGRAKRMFIDLKLASVPLATSSSYRSLSHTHIARRQGSRNSRRRLRQPDDRHALPQRCIDPLFQLHQGARRGTPARRSARLTAGPHLISLQPSRASGKRILTDSRIAAAAQIFSGNCVTCIENICAIDARR